MIKTTKPKMSVEEFMVIHKPDRKPILARLRADIVALIASGYSLKSVHEYVTANGYKGGYAALTKWVRNNIDQDKETSNTSKA